MSTFKVGDIVKPCDHEAFEREFGDVQVFSLKKIPDGSVEAVVGVPINDKPNEENSYE